MPEVVITLEILILPVIQPILPNGTIFDTTNARKLFSIPFDDPVSYEVKTEYEDVLVYGLVLSIGLALFIVAFITYKHRQKISRRFEYENI